MRSRARVKHSEQAALPFLFASLNFSGNDEQWLQFGADQISDTILTHVTRISMIVGFWTFINTEHDHPQQDKIVGKGRSLLSRLTSVSELQLCITMGGLTSRVTCVKLAAYWSREAGLLEALKPANALRSSIATIKLLGAEDLAVNNFDWCRLLSPISGFKDVTLVMTITEDMLSKFPSEKRITLDMGPVTNIDLQVQASNDRDLHRLPYLLPITSLVLNFEDISVESIFNIVSEHAASLDTLDLSVCGISLEAVYNKDPICMPLLKTLNMFFREDISPDVLRAIHAPNLVRIDLGDLYIDDITWLAQCWNTLFPVERFASLSQIELCVLQIASTLEGQDLPGVETSLAAFRSSLALREQELVVRWEVVVDSGCPFDEDEHEDGQGNETSKSMGLDRFQDMLADEAWRVRMVGVQLHLNDTYAKHKMVEEALRISLPALDKLELHICDDRDRQRELEILTRTLDTPLLKTLVIDIVDGSTMCANVRQIEKLLTVLPQLREVRLRPLVLLDHEYDVPNVNVEVLSDLVSHIQKSGLMCSVKAKHILV